MIGASPTGPAGARWLETRAIATIARTGTHRSPAVPSMPAVLLLAGALLGFPAPAPTPPPPAPVVGARTAPLAADDSLPRAARAARADTTAAAARLPGVADRADSIVVEKRARRLVLYRAGVPLRSYQVALGGNPLGPKRRRGDRRTPEGLYRIESRNPRSRYHLALRISYPSAADRATAAAQGADPGGDIMIHGLPPRFASMGAAHRATDWTEGCIALTNAEVEELWRAVPDGTPIEIKP